MAKKQLDERFDRRTNTYHVLYQMTDSDATEKDQFVVETDRDGQLVQSAGFADEGAARQFLVTGERQEPNQGV